MIEYLLAAQILSEDGSSRLKKIPRGNIEDIDIGNKTVDELKEFWNALGYEEGLCVYQPDASSGRIQWRRCLVDKRDHRK